MFQKRPIHAQTASIKPVVRTQIEFYEDIASTPKGVAIADGCYVAGYDEDGNLKAVRRVVLDTDEEKRLLKSRNLEKLTDIYHHTLQFRA